MVGYGFLCGWWSRAETTVLSVRHGLRREARLLARLEASNRLLAQATKKRDPDAIDWSVLGV